MRPSPISAATSVLLLSALALGACSSEGGGATPDRADAAGSGSPSGGASTAPAAAPLPTVEGALGPEFFGMHDADPVASSWPAAPVGSLRVWDSGVVWSQVETSPGVYDFTRLDAIVKTARDQDAEPLIVLGQTPTFHSRKPKKVGAYGKGAASMPDLAAWTAYVRAVVQRYAGADAPGKPGPIAFQVWNEANVEGYWSGTPRQMARLTSAARDVVDEVTAAPGAVGEAPLLVAPAMATRTLGQRAFLRLFYSQRIAGVPVGDLVDVVSLQLYPEVGEGPERSDALLTEARRILDLQGVPEDTPVWDTEINYGLQGGVPAEPAPPEQQQANVALTYLLNAGSGVQRVYWYAWDLHTIADTDLVEDDNESLTPAGEAFAVVSRWLLGTRVDSCKADKQGTWRCVVTAPEGQRTVFWNPEGNADVRTGFSARSVEVLGQPAETLPLGGGSLQVGTLPVLVGSSPAASSVLPPLG